MILTRAKVSTRKTRLPLLDWTSLEKWWVLIRLDEVIGGEKLKRVRLDPNVDPKWNAILFVASLRDAAKTAIYKTNYKQI